MDVFNCASDQSIRAIFTALCDDSVVYAKALRYLEKIEPSAIVKGQIAALNQPDSKKRKADSGISICVQCQQPFDEAANHEQACLHHWGNLEPDEEGDFWADHEEDHHGPIDTEENKREFPEGFIWDCCQECGTNPGCHRGPHVSNPCKKGLYASESVGGEDVGEEEHSEGGEEEQEEEEEEDEEDE
ncbi:hypothetical protein QBC46DRAFT_397399 [Diplogelasinospora grovesii]|uniref:C2H2-type domain-containing protein n=1 Tax=Diplogelasinospora grovesii TaxID=303347 RepID=A0AAN6S012_9PEZI|nr:hypothetical protein QBC46DRAFT_397399 [Diplogelasinospora grovesii]